MAATAGGAVPAANALEFLRIVGKLKRTKRSGWVHRGVEEPESVADHSYRMAMCSFLCQGGGYDTTRVLKIAVVHDLAESLVGDLAPHHGVSKEEKARLEQAAMERICGTIGDAGISEEILGHFRDYEERGSPEAQLVAEIDKFEMVSAPARLAAAPARPGPGPGGRLTPRHTLRASRLAPRPRRSCRRTSTRGSRARSSRTSSTPRRGRSRRRWSHPGRQSCAASARSAWQRTRRRRAAARPREDARTGIHRHTSERHEE